MTLNDFVTFLRQRGLAVLASRGSDGHPQAALIGVAATDQGEVVFDTSRRSRKYATWAGTRPWHSSSDSMRR